MKAIIDKGVLEYLLKCEAKLSLLGRRLTPSDLSNLEIYKSSKESNPLRPITYTNIGIEVDHKVGDTIYFIGGSVLRKDTIRRIEILISNDGSIDVEYIVPSYSTSINQKHCSDKVRTLTSKLIKLGDDELCDNENS